MFDHLHKNQEKLFKSNMKSIYGEDLEKSELIDSASDFLEKGKKANLGEVREWNGIKYQKTTQGWIQAGKAKSSKENGGNMETKEKIDAGLYKDLKGMDVGDVVGDDNETYEIVSKESDSVKVKTSKGKDLVIRGEKKENGGKVEDKKEGGEKITMNNLDWGKSTEERNANLDKYESLKTDKEKEEFKRKLKPANR